MTTFLFDNHDGESRTADFPDWESAEGFAERWGWTLVGEYEGEYEGPSWLLDGPEEMQ